MAAELKIQKTLPKNLEYQFMEMQQAKSSRPQGGLPSDTESSK